MGLEVLDQQWHAFVAAPYIVVPFVLASAWVVNWLRSKEVRETRAECDLWKARCEDTERLIAQLKSENASPTIAAEKFDKLSAEVERLTVFEGGLKTWAARCAADMVDPRSLRD